MHPCRPSAITSPFPPGLPLDPHDRSLNDRFRDPGSRSPATPPTFRRSVRGTGNPGGDHVPSYVADRPMLGRASPPAWAETSAFPYSSLFTRTPEQIQGGCGSSQNGRRPPQTHCGKDYRQRLVHLDLPTQLLIVKFVVTRRCVTTVLRSLLVDTGITPVSLRSCLPGGPQRHGRPLSPFYT
jgi:hypothetical protein